MRSKLHSVDGLCLACIGFLSDDLYSKQAIQSAGRIGWIAYFVFSCRSQSESLKVKTLFIRALGGPLRCYGDVSDGHVFWHRCIVGQERS